MKKLILLGLLFAMCGSLAAQSPRRLVLRSLLLPGWGELAGGSKTGYAFIVSEALLWGSYFYFGSEQDNLDRQAYQFAHKYAGIPAGADDEFYMDLLGRYNTSGYGPWGYADALLRQAQAKYGPDATIEPDIYMTELAWDWPDKDTRLKFKSYRKDADINADRQKVMAGVIVLNHLLSALNAFRVYKGGQRLQAQAGYIGNINTPALQVRFDF